MSLVIYAQDFTQVKDLIQQGDFDDAIKAAKSLVKDAPESAEAHYWMGMSLFSSYCNAENFKNHDTKSLIDAGISLDKAQFLDANVLNKISDLNLLKTFNSKTYNLGVTSYQDGDMELAYTYFNMSARTSDWMGKLDQDALYFTGHCALKLNNTQGAVKYLSQAHAMAPENIKVIKELAKAKEANGDLESCVALLNKGLVFHPENEDLWYMLMSANATLGNNEDALAAAQTLSHMDSVNDQNLAFLGSMYDRTGDIEKAKKTYMKCLEINPDHEKANFNLGVLYFNEIVMALNADSSKKDTPEIQNLIELSHKHLNKVIEINPNQPKAKELLNQLGDF